MERKIPVAPFMDLVKSELDVPIRCEVVPEEEQFSAETDSYNATAVFSFSEETGSLRCAIYPDNPSPSLSLFGFSRPGPVIVRLTTGLELKAAAYGDGPSLMRPSYFAHILPEWHGDLEASLEGAYFRSSPLFLVGGEEVIELEADSWQVILEKDTDFGFLRGAIKRIDGESFRVKEVEQLRNRLETFLSFIYEWPASIGCMVAGNSQHFDWEHSLLTAYDPDLPMQPVVGRVAPFSGPPDRLPVKHNYDLWFPKLFAAFVRECQDPKVSGLLDGIIYRYVQACEEAARSFAPFSLTTSYTALEGAVRLIRHPDMQQGQVKSKHIREVLKEYQGLLEKRGLDAISLFKEIEKMRPNVAHFQGLSIQDVRTQGSALEAGYDTRRLVNGLVCVYLLKDDLDFQL